MKQIVSENIISENHKNLERLINEPLRQLNKADNDYDRKVLEICHAAKFLMLLNSGYEISIVREKPDFIIKSDKEKQIGLEHEILIDQLHKKSEGSFSDLVKIIEDRFRIRHPNENILVNIFVNSAYKFKQKDKSKLVERLLLMIENYVYHDIFEENDLIHFLSCSKHSGLSFNSNSGAWWQDYLRDELVINSIEKKEKKRLDYISNTGLKEQWLLIVIGSLGQSSYEVNSDIEYNFKTISGFDKIYLMEDFKAKLYELK